MNVAKICQIHCNGIYKIHLNVYMCMNATIPTCCVPALCKLPQPSR